MIIVNMFFAAALAQVSTDMPVITEGQNATACVFISNEIQRSVVIGIMTQEMSTGGKLAVIKLFFFLV